MSISSRYQTFYANLHWVHNLSEDTELILGWINCAGWSSGTSGTDPSLSVFFLFFFVSSQHVCVMTAATPSSHLTSNGEKLTWTDDTQSSGRAADTNGLPLSAPLKLFGLRLVFRSWAASLSLSPWTSSPKRTVGSVSRAWSHTFMKCLSTVDLVLAKEPQLWRFEEMVSYQYVKHSFKSKFTMVYLSKFGHLFFTAQSWNALLSIAILSLFASFLHNIALRMWHHLYLRSA